MSLQSSPGRREGGREGGGRGGGGRGGRGREGGREVGEERKGGRCIVSCQGITIRVYIHLCSLLAGWPYCLLVN